MITGTLKSQVDKVWEAFWTGGISNPITVIEQFTYLIFLRQLDAQQTFLEKRANRTKIPIQNPIFTEAENILRWSYFKQESAEVMFERFTEKQVAANNQNVFDHMKNLDSKGGVFANYMKNAIFSIPKPKLLQQVVDMISEINMENRDATGDLYEYLLSKLSTAGTNGQFRTPRHIINMMVEMTEPKKEDTICDPSAGTAGFLVSVGNYIEQHHNDWFLDANFKKHFDSDMFSGLEFDATMIRIAAMNLQLHGIEKPELMHVDALSKSNEISDAYSLILANPPFKGSLDYDSVEPSILKMVKTKKTELLFLALMVRMMKLGGRTAVIVPDGVLFGSSNAHKNIRKTIVEDQKLQAVISMPSGVFKPYAGVSTAILLFTKTNSGGTDKVWFYDMKADGFSLDDKRAAIDQNDIPDIIERFHHLEEETKRKRTDPSFLVPFEEIKKNDWDLSINRYKEIVYEEVVYDPPKSIINRIEQLNQERLDLLMELKKEL